MEKKERKKRVWRWIKKKDWPLPLSNEKCGDSSFFSLELHSFDFLFDYLLLFCLFSICQGIYLPTYLSIYIPLSIWLNLYLRVCRYVCIYLCINFTYQLPFLVTPFHLLMSKTASLFSLVISYSYFHANCSFEIPNRMPILLKTPRQTRISSPTHPMLSNFMMQELTNI